MEKLINPGVGFFVFFYFFFFFLGLHQNKVDEFLKNMVVSELSTNYQGSSMTSAQMSSFSNFFKYVKNEFQNGTRFDSVGGGMRGGGGGWYGGGGMRGVVWGGRYA